MRRSYNLDEPLHFLFDSDDEYQRKILDKTDTSSSESENEEDNFMMNIPQLLETLEERTTLLHDKQKQKRTKGLINSLETAIDENTYKNYVSSIPKNSIESEIDKVLCKSEKFTVSRGRPNAANARKRASPPEKGCQSNTSII